MSEHGAYQFDEKACEATHKSIESRFSNINWVFGIIITLQLACFSFVGWLSTRVMVITADEGIIHEKILNMSEKQQHVITTLDKIWDKLDNKGKNP